MNWGSWSEFWSMGGRGAFVWGSYAVVALAVIAEIASIRSRLARARRAISPRYPSR
jgi:heme exporter protein D